MALNISIMIDLFYCICILLADLHIDRGDGDESIIKDPSFSAQPKFFYSSCSFGTINWLTTKVYHF